MGTVLITGVAGFIGSHLSERLLARGETVVGVDNFDPFYDRAVKQRNLEGSRAGDAFTFVEADICDAEKMQAVFAEHAPDAVVHIAALAGVRPSIERPGDYMRVNVDGTTSLLEAAAKHGSPKFIFASSSSVYGNNTKIPFSEDDPVDHPISPYAATKRACELLAHSIHHIWGMSVWCLRFFTVYGPRQRPDLAIHKFARRILAGQPIQMYGDGSASRDYTYVDDVVAGIRRALERCRGYEIVNLGSTRPIALSEMIRTVAEACGREPVIERLPMQPGDVDRTFADVSKAARLLDYAPATDFRVGVERFVSWVKAHP